MKKKWMIALVLTFAVLWSLPAVAAGSWERLGTRKVNHLVEKDTISVTAAEGRYSKIKVKVRNRHIRLLDLKVHFGNGDVQDIAVRSYLKAGSETRVIDLSGGARIIKKVTMIYESDGNKRKRGEVVLFGKH